ncbi:transposase [Galbibacter sp. EGI 63066]|uniref:IS110 family transposase n=1 Tax=Galbibacter sp. EGI 63066 TaxID=2993559 RepID=UPI0022498FCD|nr:transposase [Galbibacter sp. EGI 63066]MCX2679112.1 transposase [Galbibacter sp. EGI 63066]
MGDLFQSVGIDIAKEKFDVCFKEIKGKRSIIKGTRVFGNSSKGFEAFHQWCAKRKRENASLVFVMEATGVYYEELAYYLCSKKERVYVELPQKVKYFAKSLNIKTKTDKVDAKLIADIGLERPRSLSPWNPPSEGFKAIRDVSRQLSQLKRSKSAVSSQLHAWKAAHGTMEEVVKATEEHLGLLNQLIHKTESLLLNKVKQDRGALRKSEQDSPGQGVGGDCRNKGDC